MKKTTSSTKVNIWRNTYEVLDWFNSIQNKQKASFIVFDIVDFYPSISKHLLSAALDFASQYTTITDLEKKHNVPRKENPTLL